MKATPVWLSEFLNRCSRHCRHFWEFQRLSSRRSHHAHCCRGCHPNLRHTGLSKDSDRTQYHIAETANDKTRLNYTE